MFGVRRYTRLKTWWNGWRDARKGYPAKDANNMPHFLHELKTGCDFQLAELAKKWNELEKRTVAEFRRAIHRQERASIEVERAEKAAAEARIAYENAETDLAELEHVSPGRAGYAMFFIFLVLAELPVNYVVFDLFGEARWLTLVMSLLLCFTLPWTAHILGASLKRGVKNKPVEAVKCVIAVVVVLGLLGSVAYVRQAYFGAIESQEALGIQVNKDVVTLLFFLINGMAFLAGTWTSYNAHPADPVRFRAIRQRYGKARENLAKAEARLEAAYVQVESSSDALDNIISERMNGFEAMQNKALQIMKNWDNDVQYYCKINVRHRKDGQVPDCFHTKVNYYTPETMKMLKWDIGDIVAQDGSAGAISGKDGIVVPLAVESPSKLKEVRK